MRERQLLEESIAGITHITSTLNDSIELIALGEEEGDSSIVVDAENTIHNLKGEIDKRQIEMLLLSFGICLTDFEKPFCKLNFNGLGSQKMPFDALHNAPDGFYQGPKLERSNRCRGQHRCEKKVVVVPKPYAMPWPLYDLLFRRDCWYC